MQTVKSAANLTLCIDTSTAFQGGSTLLDSGGYSISIKEEFDSPLPSPPFSLPPPALPVPPTPLSPPPITPGDISGDGVFDVRSRR